VAAIMTITIIGGWSSQKAIGQIVSSPDEPPVFGKREERPWLKIDGFDGHLDFNGQRIQNSTTNGNAHEQDVENLYTESVTLHTHGAIIHPNLVELDLSGTVGLQQQDFSSDANGRQLASSNSNDLLTAFGLFANILRNENVNYTLYAQRYQDTISRTFGPSLTTDTTVYGATATAINPEFPLRFKVERSENNQNDPSGLQGYHQEQNLAQAHGEWIQGLASRLSLDYTFTDLSQKADQGKPLSDQIHDVNVSHDFRFGEQHQQTLSSNLSLYDDTGDSEQRRVRASEQLSLRHTDDLQSYYRYDFSDNSRLGLDQTTHLGEVGFDHRLYQSLQTHGAVGGQLIDQSQGATSQDAYAKLNFDYTKLVPLGTLGLNLGGSYDWRNTDDQTAPVQVLDQPGSFGTSSPTPDTIIILRQNVDPNSVVLTDDRGLRQYVRNVDYVVRSFVNRTEIQRVVTGAIQPGQSVLVDYTVAPQPANVLQTGTVYLGGHYDFERGPLAGLSIYSRAFFQTQSTSNTSLGTVLPEDINEYIGGAVYRIGPFSFTGEYTLHDSTLSAYQSERFGATFYQPIFPTIFLSLSTDYTLTQYSSTTQNVDYLNVTGSLNYQVNRELQLTAGASFRDQKDSSFGDVTGIEEQVRIQWRHRETFIYAQFRNANLDSNGSSNMYQFFEVGLQRKF
jgi:hypothetical protein